MNFETGKKERYMKVENAFSEYSERLFAYVYGVTGDQAEARDITAESFARLLSEPGLASPDFKVKSWLFKVATNLSRNFITRFLKRILTFPDFIIDTMCASKSDVPEEVVRNEEFAELTASLRKLGKNDREILFLKYYEQMSYEDISEVTGVPAGTVASRLSRAIERLSNELKKAGTTSLKKEEFE